MVWFGEFEEKDALDMVQYSQSLFSAISYLQLLHTGERS